VRSARDCLSAVPAPILDALSRAPGRSYLVGGFVRDVLLGRPTHDVDLAVDGDAGRLARTIAGPLDAAVVALDAERGTYRMALRRPLNAIQALDLTRLRDPAIEGDLAGRDFTINAVAVPLGEEPPRFLDPTGGIADLERRRIRAASPRAFDDDPLRLLRAVRFALDLGFVIDPQTELAIRARAALIARPAAERKRDELARILGCGDSAAGIELLDQLGLLTLLLPDLEEARGVEQPKEHFYNVFDHSIQTLAVLDLMLRREPPAEQRKAALWQAVWDRLGGVAGLRERLAEPLGESRPRGVMLKFAGLLHDVSKAETKSIDPETGRMRFFGHAEVGGKRAAALARALRFSTREVDYVGLLIHEHLRPGMLAAPGEVPTRRALFRFARDLGDACGDLLLLNLADHAGARGPRLTLDEWTAHVDYAAWVLRILEEDEDVSHPPKLVDGNELMRELALLPGPRIGRLLEVVREAQAAGEVGTREQALALARELLAAEQAEGMGG
jgi:tRNA nucleotidyltransferase/poly(A) polymerase